MQQGLWDLSSLTRDGTWTPSSGCGVLTIGPPGNAKIKPFFFFPQRAMLDIYQHCCDSVVVNQRAIPSWPQSPAGQVTQARPGESVQVLEKKCSVLGFCNRRRGGRAQLLKEWHCPRMQPKQLASNGAKTQPWSSISTLNDTPRGTRMVPRHCQKTKEWVATQFLEISTPSPK